MRVLKVAKHICSDIALRDRGNCQESTPRVFEPITLSLIEEFLWHFVSTSISVSCESIYNCFERSGYFLSFHEQHSTDTMGTLFQFSSVPQSCLTLCDLMDCSMPGPLSITSSWSLLKLMSIESVMPSNHLILCHPLLLLHSIFPSIRVFANESVLCIRWPKYLSFSFNFSPSNEYSGLTSIRIDRLDLLAVQGALKSLLQHHSSKTLILWCSAFFIVQLSHPYMTTGKTIALTRRTFDGKVMSLLFNMLSTLVIAFLPRRKCLLISRLQSPSTVILEPPKIKFLTVSIISPTICHKVMEPDAMILVF